MDKVHVKVKDAAELLGMDPQAIREWIKSGTCPFGTCYKATHSTVYRYKVHGVALFNYLKRGKV